MRLSILLWIWASDILEPVPTASPKWSTIKCIRTAFEDIKTEFYTYTSFRIYTKHFTLKKFSWYYSLQFYCSISHPVKRGFEFVETFIYSSQYIWNCAIYEFWSTREVYLSRMTTLLQDVFSATIYISIHLVFYIWKCSI